MRYFVDVAGQELELEVEAANGGGFRVWLTSSAGRAEPQQARILRRSEDLCSIEVDGRIVELRVGRDGEPNRVLGVSTRVESARERTAQSGERAASESASELRAPMPGRIVRVSCAPGAEVKKGEALLVIEAMKMENELHARGAAVVTEVHVAAGDTVERGALLVRFG